MQLEYLLQRATHFKFDYGVELIRSGTGWYFGRSGGTKKYVLHPLHGWITYRELTDGKFVFGSLEEASHFLDAHPEYVAPLEHQLPANGKGADA
jgi:hypothetical protein